MWLPHLMIVRLCLRATNMVNYIDNHEYFPPSSEPGSVWLTVREYRCFNIVWLRGLQCQWCDYSIIGGIWKIYLRYFFLYGTVFSFCLTSDPSFINPSITVENIQSHRHCRHVHLYSSIFHPHFERLQTHSQASQTTTVTWPDQFFHMHLHS